MNGTAFTAPGHGATVGQLHDALHAAFVARVIGQREYHRGSDSLEGLGMNRRTNLVILSGANLTPVDVRRIADDLSTARSVVL